LNVLLKSVGIITISAVAVVLAGCNTGNADSEGLATINGESITRGDWNLQNQIAGTAYPQYLLLRQRIGREPLPVGYFTLDKLIGEKLILQMAKEENVLATAQDVDTELSRILRQNPKYLEGQQALGRTRGILKDDLKVQLSRFNLITKGTKVSDAETSDYVRLHPEEFTQPASVRYRLIGVTTEAKKKKVDAELNGGTTFAIAAQQYSEDASAKDGGAMPTAAISDLPTKVRTVVEAARPLSATDWIQYGATGWVKLYIEEKTAKKYVAPDADIKAQLRRQLMLAKAQDQSNWNERFLDKLNSSKIEVKETWLANLWKREKASRQEEVKRRKEMEKANTPAGTPGASPGGSQP